MDQHAENIKLIEDLNRARLSSLVLDELAPLLTMMKLHTTNHLMNEWRAGKFDQNALTKLLVIDDLMREFKKRAMAGETAKTKLMNQIPEQLKGD